jgi:predicted Fe-S protein YdhL (DUF1289 family)
MVAVVKWKNRSPEEKLKILNDQQKLRDGVERKKVIGTPGILKDSEALVVYKAKEIPLPCLDCGWKGSDKYRVYKGQDPLGGRCEFVEGACRGCKRIVRRAFPNPLGNEGMVFVLVATELKRSGRLSDER